MVRNAAAENFFFALLNAQQEKERLISNCGTFQAQEWSLLFDLAAKTHLLPVLYDRLTGLGAAVPADFLARLKNIFFLNLRRNMLLEQELFQAINFLRARAIVSVPLKGPVLARLLYNDLGLRQGSVDLDILVAREDLAKTEKALMEFGYIPYNEDDTGSLRALKLKYARQLHAFKHIDGIGRLYLDLHWDLRGFFVDTALAEFWRNLRSVSLGGHNVLVPSFEDILLFLSQVSLSTFEFVELRYLYDIHQLLTRFGQALAWGQIISKSKQYNLDSYLYFSLYLTKSYFLTAIPSGVLRQIQPGIAKRLILGACFKRENVLYHNQRFVSSYSWRYLWSTLIPARGPIDLMHRLFRKVFLPMEEVMAMAHSGRRSYLLYGKRLFKPLYRLFKEKSARRKY